MSDCKSCPYAERLRGAVNALIREANKRDPDWTPAIRDARTALASDPAQGAGNDPSPSGALATGAKADAAGPEGAGTYDMMADLMAKLAPVAPSTERHAMPSEPTAEILEAMVRGATLGAGYEYPKRVMEAAYKALRDVLAPSPIPRAPEGIDDLPRILRGYCKEGVRLGANPHAQAALKEAADAIERQSAELSRLRAADALTEGLTAEGWAQPGSWIAVNEAMPSHGKTVLVTFKNSHGKDRITRGFYVEQFKMLWEGDDEPEDCGAELHAESGDYYVPAGWNESGVGAEFFYTIEGEVTHWMALPLAPSTGERGNG
jgi:hypothetical protein